eukprot:7093353-Pyramimonas_sp.AAC.2
MKKSWGIAATVNPRNKDGQHSQIFPCILVPSAHPWPLSLAVPHSKNIEMALQGPCVLSAHPYYAG